MNASIILDYFESASQGMFVALMLYHLANYYFMRDKSFLLYALYLFLTILFTIPYTNNHFSTWALQNFSVFFEKTKWLIEIFFIVVYVWFSYHFLNVKKGNPHLAKLARLHMRLFSTSSILFFLIDLLFFNSNYFEYFNLFVFVPLNIVLGSYLCFLIYKLNNPLSKYFLTGILIFSATSTIYLYYKYFPANNFMINNSIDASHIFILGAVFEAILISVALGYKNITYKEEKEIARNEVIKKLKENRKLKEELYIELQEKIAQKRSELLTINEVSEAQKIAQTEQKLLNEINQLKLTSLLNQMNPHFIFNALNSIKLFIINNDAKNAVYYLNKFSKLIRIILNTSTEKETTLTQELATLELYVNIENIRFSNEISYEVVIDSAIETDHIIIPSLILQPFVENAIWHGLSPKKGNKNIWVSVQKKSNDWYQIEIKDNGIGRKKSEENRAKRTIKRKSVGLEITKERLKNFTNNYPKKYTLEFIDLFDNENTAIGTVIQLPITKKSDD